MNVIAMQIYNSRFGNLAICAENDAITEVRFFDSVYEPPRGCPSALTQEAALQLDEYFAGKRKQFDLPLCIQGTDFQKTVYNALLKIPYGETRSYKQIACAAGNPKASRAVGGANNKNPMSIIVPCHRVIGADGSLTGYGGGLVRKKQLLELEARNYEC